MSDQRLRQLSGQMSGSTSVFSQVALAPPDAIFGLTNAFKADGFDKKVNLGVGAYRDDSSKPWILPVVKKAHEILTNDPTIDHEYLPIAGLPSFTSAAAKLALGEDSPAIKNNLVSSLQSISGTGANHMGAAFLSKFYQGTKLVYISNPTWPNHYQIWDHVGVARADYPYFHPETKGLDFDGVIKTLEAAPVKSIVLLHACAHNPTGVDPTQEQWKVIADVMEKKQLYPFFDSAYQGFASGDLEKDAWAVRYFVSRGFELILCQSFAKNFGLYGERAGCLHMVSRDPETAKKVMSQLQILQRSEISNPPAYGARIASIVLNDKALFAEWESNLKEMAGRIQKMRSALYDTLVKLDTPGTWNHIVDQIGMFSFLGLSVKQCDVLVKDYHIYLTKNARISIAGLNSSNVTYVAESISKVVKTVN